MTSMNRLIGLPVVFKGRTLAQVESGILDASGKSLHGLVVRRGMGGAKWLSSNQIFTLGGVSVIACQPPQRLPSACQLDLGPVWDPSGLRLGEVTDAYLDAATLRVTGLEISLGPLDDWRFGRMLARSYSLLREGRSLKVLTALEALTPLHPHYRKEGSHEPG